MNNFPPASLALNQVLADEVFKLALSEENNFERWNGDVEITIDETTAWLIFACALSGKRHGVIHHGDCFLFSDELAGYDSSTGKRDHQR